MPVKLKSSQVQQNFGHIVDRTMMEDDVMAERYGMPRVAIVEYLRGSVRDRPQPGLITVGGRGVAERGCRRPIDHTVPGWTALRVPPFCFPDKAVGQPLRRFASILLPSLASIPTEGLDSTRFAATFARVPPSPLILDDAVRVLSSHPQ